MVLVFGKLGPKQPRCLLLGNCGILHQSFMKMALSVLQLVLSVLLIVVVLLQQKGSGLGSAFGGSNSVYTTRRGVDKVLFNATIVIVVAFLVVSLAAVLI